MKRKMRRFLMRMMTKIFVEYAVIAAASVVAAIDLLLTLTLHTQ